MGIKKRNTARRLATVLAAIGVLVMSSGVALMVTASSADAAKDGNHKYFVCKYVGKPGVDEVLQTGQNPISVSENAIPEDPVVVGSFFADAQGRSYVLVEDTGQAEPPASECPGSETPPTATTATVTFVDPSCDNDNTASYSTSGTGIDFSLQGTVAPGESVTVTATAQSGYVLQGQSQFTHTFSAAADCSTVSPPTVTPPAVKPPKSSPQETVAATPTVVHAGLVSVNSRFGGQEGLALLVAGMIIMVIAGGLGMVRPDGGTSQK